MAKSLDVHTLCMTHARVDRWLRTHISNALEDSQLTMMEWLLLMSIHKHEKEGLIITEIAELLGVSLPQVTALTHQLLNKKFLKQQVERQDRRSRRLCITPEGSVVSRAAARKLEGVVNNISEAPQLRSYRQLLARLVQQPMLQ